MAASLKRLEDEIADDEHTSDENTSEENGPECKLYYKLLGTH